MLRQLLITFAPVVHCLMPGVLLETSEPFELKLRLDLEPAERR